ncbi:MAG: GNAT family N-acetyltransferase, partial [Magnetococcales bacterium]|nr:GNAT family N-acetyltransferase [Magnetococcales bacterium]
MIHPSELTVTPLHAAEHPLWADFLAKAGNGAIFHDLNFLAYHPPDRYNFNHLLIRHNKQIIALLPGGLLKEDGKLLFSSPLGASFGGLVLAPSPSADLVRACVIAVQDYVCNAGWSGIDMILPPPYYSSPPNQVVDFSLYINGFTLYKQWLCHGIQLTGGDILHRLHKKQACGVRAAIRMGIKFIESGKENLAHFIELFNETYQRHGVSPTHSETEIADLMQRFPERIRLHLAFFEDHPVAGVLLFHVTKQVAYTFYICRNQAYAKYYGTSALFTDIVCRLSATGFTHVDLGPSASKMNFNYGVAKYKE